MFFPISSFHVTGKQVAKGAFLILSIATPTSQACAQALKKAGHLKGTPLIFTAVTDPKAAGLVSDLERPRGAITGVSDLLPVDEHLKMVTSFLPNLKTLGTLHNAGEANSKDTVASIRAESKKMGFEVIEATVSKSSDFWPEHRRAAFIGRVFQDPLQWTCGGLTIEQNMALAAKRGACRGLRRGEPDHPGCSGRGKSGPHAGRPGFPLLRSWRGRFFFGSDAAGVIFFS